MTRSRGGHKPQTPEKDASRTPGALSTHRGKRRLSNVLAKYVVNPLTKPLAGYVPFWALLETTGRKSGLPRRVPVGNGLRGDTFWLVADHGRSADYVKNIEANPRVRVRVGGVWRDGIAYLMPEDDPRARQRSLRKLNALFVRLAGTNLLTLRIELEAIDGRER